MVINQLLGEKDSSNPPEQRGGEKAPYNSSLRKGSLGA
jgi:hypothetical protein